MLSDLNSKIPVLLEPIDIHAVLSGTGKNHGVIEYTKDEYEKKLKQMKLLFIPLDMEVYLNLVCQ